MKNKEASEWFKKRAQEAPMPGAREAFKLAAEALANADVPDNNVGDLISRQGVIDAGKELCETCDEQPNGWCGSCRMNEFFKAIEALPPAQPEPCTGHWHITDAYPHNVYCSECHKRFAQTHWEVWEDGSLPRNFCPNCGAKMEGVSE